MKYKLKRFTQLLTILIFLSMSSCGFCQNQLPNLAQKVFKKEHCDYILKNSNYFDVCYSCKYKDPLATYDKLVGNLVVKKMKRVNPFHPDLNIPKKCRSYPKDYSHSGFDKGHSGANNASFDWSKKSQYATFVMSNIVPQRPNTNRRSYLRVEKYGRCLAVKDKFVNVLTINEFSKDPKTISKDKVAIPTGFWKIYWNGKTMICFYIPNDNKIYKLKDLRKPCSQVGELK